MKFTIFGSSGFVGKHLTNYIKNLGHECFCPDRNLSLKKGDSLGHIIYCIGLTSDFRDRPLDTIEAHVCLLAKTLSLYSFESFLYLSSTRIYQRNISGSESSNLIINPNDFSDLYNISKVMGESICLSFPNKKVRIARLSNVIGDDFNSGNFLYSIILEAVKTNEIHLHQSPDVERDYIGLDCIVDLLVKIAINGKERIYNLASGFNISNREVVTKIASILKCGVFYEKETAGFSAPIIKIEKIEGEFAYRSKNILNKVEELVRSYKDNYNDTN
jgi:nucleoside-diphosphate-sugar epimerase